MSDRAKSAKRSLSGWLPWLGDPARKMLGIIMMVLTIAGLLWSILWVIHLVA